jgi:hypothetical protein
MRYTVYVDENSHYMDESERYTHGEFPTAEAAIAAAKRIVDDYLLSALKPGMTPDALYRSYVDWGEDPFIIAVPKDPECEFSAWDYAKQRCRELCGEAPGAKTDA